jgi:hypothetical protein
MANIVFLTIFQKNDKGSVDFKSKENKYMVDKEKGKNLSESTYPLKITLTSFSITSPAFPCRNMSVT